MAAAAARSAALLLLVCLVQPCTGTVRNISARGSELSLWAPPTPAPTGRRAARRRLSRTDHIVWHGKVPRVSAPSRHYLFVHIPKAAGVSFMKDSPHAMPVGSTLRGSQEKAVLDPRTVSLRKAHGAQLIVLLRNPIGLAYSQFIMSKCYPHAARGASRSPHRPPCAPAHLGFGTWAADLARQLAAPPSARRLDSGLGPHGYIPIDVQSRYVSTNVSAWHVRRSDVPGDLTRAKAGLARFAFVGVTELYPQSVCLFAAHALGALPAHCECAPTHKAARSAPKLTRVTHGLPKHSLADLSATARAAAASLVRVDLELYAHALEDRLSAQIEQAERARSRPGGAGLDCYRAKVAALRAELGPAGAAVEGAESRSAQAAVGRNHLTHVPASSSSRRPPRRPPRRRRTRSVLTAAPRRSGSSSMPMSTRRSEYDGDAEPDGEAHRLQRPPPVMAYGRSGHDDDTHTM